MTNHEDDSSAALAAITAEILAMYEQAVKGGMIAVEEDVQALSPEQQKRSHLARLLTQDAERSMNSIMRNMEMHERAITARFEQWAAGEDQGFLDAKLTEGVGRPVSDVRTALRERFGDGLFGEDGCQIVANHLRGHYSPGESISAAVLIKADFNARKDWAQKHGPKWDEPFNSQRDPDALDLTKILWFMGDPRGELAPVEGFYSALLAQAERHGHTKGQVDAAVAKLFGGKIPEGMPMNRVIETSARRIHDELPHPEGSESTAITRAQAQRVSAQTLTQHRGM